MGNREQIRIISRHHGELSSKVEMDGLEYLAITEDSQPHIITRVYFKGKVLSTTKSDYADLLKTSRARQRVEEFMTRQHRRVIESFKKERTKSTKVTADYISDVRSLLGKKNYRSALDLLRDGLESRPNDPFLLSYYGCLEALVNRNFKLGIDACNKAIHSLRGKLPFGEEFYLPTFYLNLGRAYLAAGKKREATRAFSAGFKTDPEHPDILWEMKKLGLRSELPVSFLARSNPINKYIGMLLHKMRS
jgi:tetratricopeptide (TPR) repeat protein